MMGMAHPYKHASLPKCVAIPNSYVNKDWTCKDKDQAYKHQDKEKD